MLDLLTQVTARKVWNTFANKRVYVSLPGVVNTPFAKAGIPINLCLIRENIEDVYGAIEHSQTNDVTQCRRLVTRPGSLQVHKYAFESARARNAKRVTCGHKSNIMKLTDGLFLETFYQVAKEYPDIKADDAIIDDLAMKLVMRPQDYDIIVSTNLQGDILSDLAAGLIGGLGLCPSSNIGDNIVLFEAVHGTAPDIAGKNLANPTALILSGCMMLRHVGLGRYAEAIQESLLKTIEAGYVTKDLADKPGAKTLSTTDFTEAVIDHFSPELKNHTSALNVATPNITINLTENIMHTTAKKVPEKTIGMDLFVDSDMKPKALAAKLLPLIPSHLKLVMISNRGTQVWPTGSVFTELVNHYRVRIEEPQLNSMNESELLQLAQVISKHLRICSMEMLRVFGEKRGYSMAQGQ
jgi:isocitrate dehydrogenase